MLELSISKKKTQVLRLGGAQYLSIISTTSMIHCKKGATLTTEKVLDGMHLQGHLAGGKLKDDKDSNDKDCMCSNKCKERGDKVQWQREEKPQQR